MFDFTQIRCIWALTFLAFALWTSVRQRNTECITKRRLRVVFQNGAASATSDEAPWTSRRAAAGAAQGKVTECVMAPRGARTLRPRRPTAMPRRLGLVFLSDADNHDDVLSTAAGRCWCSCSAPRPPPGPAAGRMSPWRSERTAPAVGGAPPTASDRAVHLRPSTRAVDVVVRHRLAAHRAEPRLRRRHRVVRVRAQRRCPQVRAEPLVEPLDGRSESPAVWCPVPVPATACHSI